MKGFLSRAVASTIARGESRRNRLARWSRWFPSAPAVDDTRFRGQDEAYPRHWRQFPDRWPAVDPDDPAVEEALTEAVEELPDRWREVVRQRDVADREPGTVAEDVGVTPEQERAMLNRARAVLRERLARLVSQRRAR